MVTVDDLSIYRNQVRRIAGRAWIDLVFAEDYFDPRGGLLLKDPPVGATQGEFVVRLNPELHPVGDFVTRCMTRRVEVWMACLKEYRKMCLDAVLRVGRRDAPPVTAERQAWKDLASASSSLRALCLTGPDAAVRDLSVILTQVYSAFHPRHLSWPGLPGPLVAADAGILRHRVTNVRDVEMVERIAAAVGDLRRAHRDFPPGLPARDEAIASRGLVLLNQPRLVYWEAKRINVDWDRHNLPWKLLRALAVKAPLGAAVELRDVYGDRAVSESALTTLNGRLKELLPASLWKLIRPTGQRSYRLHLGRNGLNDLP